MGWKDTIMSVPARPDDTEDTGGGSGGGGGGTGSHEQCLYISNVPGTETVGGIDKGFTSPKGITFQDFVDKMLHKYQFPAFSSFSLVGQATTVEVGETVPANLKFSFAVTNPDNIVPNSIKITDVTSGAVIAQNFGTTSPVTSTSAQLPNSTATSRTFRISGKDTQGNTFTKDVTIYWRWSVYYGESNNPTIDSDIVENARGSLLQASYAGSFAFLGGGYKFLAYPSGFGTAKKFIDPSTKFDVPFQPDFTLQVTNKNGISQTYRVHRTTYELGGAITVTVS